MTVDNHTRLFGNYLEYRQYQSGTNAGLLSYEQWLESGLVFNAQSSMKLREEIAALRADLDAANARAQQAERFYVYRKDSYEPGGLEHWNAFESLEQAQREIENGLMYETMLIYCSRDNVLIEFMEYEQAWNEDYTEAIYRWRDIDSVADANAGAETEGAAAEIAEYERKFGMSGAEFLKRWEAYEIQDTYEANHFAALIRFNSAN